MNETTDSENTGITSECKPNCNSDENPRPFVILIERQSVDLKTKDCVRKLSAVVETGYAFMAPKMKTIQDSKLKATPSIIAKLETKMLETIMQSIERSLSRLRKT